MLPTYLLSYLIIYCLTENSQCIIREHLSHFPEKDKLTEKEESRREGT